MKRFVDYPEYNKTPISSVLDGYLMGRRGAAVLELAGGTGQHASYFARRYPTALWTSTDYENTESIQAYVAEVPNARCCILDASKPLEWGRAPLIAEGPLDMVFVANMTHISPYECTAGLFAGAARHLKGSGRVVIYGPFGRNGRIEPASNAQFDQSLRQRNPLWGYRDVEAQIIPTAGDSGFVVEAIHAMPENNWLLVFKRAGEESVVEWPAPDGALLSDQLARAKDAADAHSSSISAVKPPDSEF